MLPTPRKVEVSAGLAVNDSILSFSSPHSYPGCLKHGGAGGGGNKEKVSWIRVAL